MKKILNSDIRSGFKSTFSPFLNRGALRGRRHRILVVRHTMPRDITCSPSGDTAVIIAGTTDIGSQWLEENADTRLHDGAISLSPQDVEAFAARARSSGMTVLVKANPRVKR